MSGDHPKWDYLFVSDLHLSQGYDPERRTYHAREDFFFDEPFFRWLRWADENCAQGRRWELVFVGDALDFFPVDQEAVAQYCRERARRQRELDLSDARQVAQYWQRQFGQAVPTERAPERIQRLIFEDDVLAGRLELVPRFPGRAPTTSPDATPVPEWAARLYAHYRPEVAEAPRKGDAPFALQTLAEEEAAAFRAAGEGEPVPTSGERSRQDRAHQLDVAFEQQYAFLPTPEKSADKLASIYRGHPLFFRALAWFVGQGHRLVFLRGNHDLELFWPRVQERLREFVAREYPAAFGYDEGHPLPPDFQERIDFRPGWFYYRRGAFYAEHGCQHEMLNASPNPIRPLMPRNEHLLSPDVGCLGVLCLHNHLESEHPEWENRGDHTRVLVDLIRREPFKMLAILIRHAPDFLRMAQRLWMAGKEKDLRPTEEDCCQYAGTVGLDPGMVRKIYDAGDTPLLLRRPLAWLLFSPGGHVVKVLLLLALAALAVGLVALWYLVVTPALAGLIPGDFPYATVGSASQLLAKFLLWLAPPVVYALVRRRRKRQHSGPFLFEAARRIYAHLQEEDPSLRYYIAGHDHQPDTRIVERREDGRHVYYLNTGSWTPWFAEGEQRLRTLGQEVQFTFARLVKGEGGYEADLLRWNDDAGRADPQIVPAARTSS
jgi:UDP-2,3-diacylglucosamine pyrophosphatase LpxH